MALFVVNHGVHCHAIRFSARRIIVLNGKSNHGDANKILIVVVQLAERRQRQPNILLRRLSLTAATGLTAGRTSSQQYSANGVVLKQPIVSRTVNVKCQPFSCYVYS